MAKQSSAYYSGLQRASKGVSLADFSVVSKKVEQVAREKAQEKVNKKKERDQLQLKMLELYGPEIYSGFDNVGLDNVDMVAGKISSKIKQVADANNALFNEGAISEGEYATRMSKMIGQSRKVAKDFSKISGYVDTVREKGDSASLVSRKNLESLNNLYGFAGVDIDENMNLSFFTQGEDEEGSPRIEVTPFDKFGKFTEYRDAFDFNEVSENIFKVDKTANQYFKGGTVLKTFRDRGENFSPEQNKYIENYARETLYNDQDELYDAASRAGVKFTTDSFGNIKEYDRVFKETTDYIKEKVKNDYLLRESEDDVASQNVSINLRSIALRERQFNKSEKDSRNYDVSYYNEQSGKRVGEGEMYEFTVKKPVSLKQFQSSGFTKIAQQGVPADADVNIIGYRQKANGDHVAIVGYTTETGDLMTGIQKQTVTKTIPLLDRLSVNQIRTKIGMPLLTDIESQELISGSRTPNSKEQKPKAY
jgi:hypothetical protein